METLEELIRVGLKRGVIESCERDEEGWFWVTEGPITYCLKADQVRHLLESLLQSRE